MCASASPATTAAAASPIASRSTIPAGSRSSRVLDIVPTWAMWHGMDARLAMRAWHWTFLAQPAPLPETLIGKDPRLLSSTTRGRRRHQGKDSSAFDPRALAHYRASFTDPLRIHATCEDYRAGRTTDLAHDEADRAAGKKITCPCWRCGARPAAFRPRPMGRSTTWREWATRRARLCHRLRALSAPRKRRRRPPRRCWSFSLRLRPPRGRRPGLSRPSTSCFDATGA